MLVPRGDWQRAEDRVWQVLRHGYPDASERALLGFLLAATGRTEQARTVWGEIVSAELTRGRTNVVMVQAWKAMGAWAIGADDAADQLQHADVLARSIGLHAPRVIAFRRDLVEALIAAGRRDEAHAALERMRADADRNLLANAAADADAAEALLVADDGDDDRAAQLIAQAVKTHDHAGERYELARSLLSAGRLARRAGRRLDARRDLEAAVELFTSFGATWTARCHAGTNASAGDRAAARRSPTPSGRSPSMPPPGSRTPRSPRRCSCPCAPSSPTCRAPIASSVFAPVCSSPPACAKTSPASGTARQLVGASPSHPVGSSVDGVTVDGVTAVGVTAAGAVEGVGCAAGGPAASFSPPVSTRPPLRALDGSAAASQPYVKRAAATLVVVARHRARAEESQRRGLPRRDESARTGRRGAPARHR